MEKVITFLSNESGASAVEYGLLVALIVVVIIASVTTFGMSVNESLYQKLVNNLS